MLEYMTCMFYFVILESKVDVCPQLLQLFRGTLQHCFAVNLQNCFVDYEPLPDFPSA